MNLLPMVITGLVAVALVVFIVLALRTRCPSSEFPPLDPELRSRLTVLRSNHGFDHPELWLRHPKVRTFRQVVARAIPRCPDCGGDPAGVLGQYVYHSTLLRLKTCADCGLIWSDAAIDPAVLTAHFEGASKDTGYFVHSRAAVFEQLAALIDEQVPHGGSVLDVGGGMGHLMARVRQMRPDIDATVLDISSRSVDYAKSHFDLKAIRGTVKDLQGERYDAVICSDVIYYENDIKACWEALSRITRGALIIRGPHKLTAIRFRQWLRNCLSGADARLLQDSVPGFNPEHRFVLSRPYLTRRLQGLGFTVCTVPAATLETGTLARVAGRIARLAGRTTALVVIARRAS